MRSVPGDNRYLVLPLKKKQVVFNTMHPETSVQVLNLYAPKLKRFIIIMDKM